MPVECVVWIVLAALVGLGTGSGATWWLVRRGDRANLQSAARRVADLEDQARKNADNILKEAEFKAKDELFKKRERVPFETYVARLRVQRAKQLLSDTELDVTRVAELSMRLASASHSWHTCARKSSPAGELSVFGAASAVP